MICPEGGRSGLKPSACWPAVQAHICMHGHEKACMCCLYQCRICLYQSQWSSPDRSGTAAQTAVLQLQSRMIPSGYDYTQRQQWITRHYKHETIVENHLWGASSCQKCAQRRPLLPQPFGTSVPALTHAQHVPTDASSGRWDCGSRGGESQAMMCIIRRSWVAKAALWPQLSPAMSS